MAKLVLYSDQVIKTNKKVDIELLKLLNKNNASIAYIPSASDPTRKYFQAKVNYYKDLGINNVNYFDLDEEYDELKAKKMFNFDAIHLSGGNTFYFLNLLNKRGFIELLKNYVRNGGILIGISAGSILMTKKIDTAAIGKGADDNSIGIMDNTALGIVDFEFAPHWTGSYKQVKLLKKYAKANKTTVYACKDGSGIVVNGDDIKIIGDIEKIQG